MNTDRTMALPDPQQSIKPKRTGFFILLAIIIIIIVAAYSLTQKKFTAAPAPTITKDNKQTILESLKTPAAPPTQAEKTLIIKRFTGQKQLTSEEKQEILSLLNQY